MNLSKYRLLKITIIEKLIELLKSIYDPEILINIYELGLIYDIQINQQANIKIIMTLTTPNCPIADNLVKEIKQKISIIDNKKYINIILTFDPIWNTDHLSEETKFKLGLK